MDQAVHLRTLRAPRGPAHPPTLPPHPSEPRGRLWIEVEEEDSHESLEDSEMQEDEDGIEVEELDVREARIGPGIGFHLVRARWVVQSSTVV